jgi:hypothetical protein
VQQIIACVTDQLLYALANRIRPNHFDIVFLPPNQSARLTLVSRSVQPLLSLRIDLSCQPQADARNTYVSDIAGYIFRIQSSSETELLAYHWHPDGLSRQRDHHLHVSHHFDISSRGIPSLSGMHLPTGIVGLESIIQLLIEEFGVEPRRDDWHKVVKLAADSD